MANVIPMPEPPERLVGLCTSKSACELRTASVALYKWLLTVPHMEPPMEQFSIPDEVWEPFEDALFDAPILPPTEGNNDG